MPTYGYECGACGHQFEKFQSMSDKPVRKCPVCGKAKAKRQIHGGAGVLFKGAGFYQTDYRSQSYKASSEKDKPAASCSGDCKSCPDSRK
ncbi:MAG: Zinc ribbon domain protein [Candidatus Omnitrophica bacterium ADurb.Bin277]|nr:MAG: Zinc ribbon domain protein [Candidatus Omnitrophica bacterium ADurb.Bin277]